MPQQSTDPRTRVIDGVEHVWSIFDNAWVPLSWWQEIESARRKRNRTRSELAP